MKPPQIGTAYHASHHTEDAGMASVTAKKIAPYVKLSLRWARKTTSTLSMVSV